MEINQDRLTATEERSKNNAHKIEEMTNELAKLKERQDNLESLTTSVAVMANKQETMESDLKEIKQDVKVLASIPAKRWESIVEKVLMLLVGAAVTYALSHMGL